MNHTTTRTARFYDQQYLIESRRHSNRLAEIEAMKYRLLQLDADFEALREAGHNVRCAPAAAYLRNGVLMLQIETATAEEQRAICKVLNARGFEDKDSLSDYIYALERDKIEFLISLARPRDGHVATYTQERKQ